MENVEEIYLHYYTPIIFLSCDVSAPLFQWMQWTIVKHVYYSRQSRWYNIPSQTFKRALVDTSCVLTLALLEECIMHLHCYSDTFYDVFVCIYLSGKEQFFSFLISFNSLPTPKIEVIRMKNLYLGNVFLCVLLFSLKGHFSIFLSFFWDPAFIITCVTWWDKYPFHIRNRQ